MRPLWGIWFRSGCPRSRRYLPAANVVDGQQQIGKSRGLEHILSTMIYPRRYVYVSIIDADTTIEPNFLTSALKLLRDTDVLRGRDCTREAAANRGGRLRQGAALDSVFLRVLGLLVVGGRAPSR